MKVITTREIRSEIKTYFDLAETERVTVKRGKKFINLIVSDQPDKVYVDQDWIKELLAIPEQYRCNPFDRSPSGDMFFADKRNIEQLTKAVNQAKKGKTTSIKDKEQLSKHLDSL